MDKFISIVKAIQAVAGALVGTLGTGGDYHNPMTWLAGIAAVEGTLNSIFHWHNT